MKDDLVELLRDIRKCRWEQRSKFTHREGWSVSELTKLLPRIDAALSTEGLTTGGGA